MILFMDNTSAFNIKVVLYQLTFLILPDDSFHCSTFFFSFADDSYLRTDNDKLQSPPMYQQLVFLCCLNMNTKNFKDSFHPTDRLHQHLTAGRKYSSIHSRRLLSTG